MSLKFKMASIFNLTSRKHFNKKNTWGGGGGGGGLGWIGIGCESGRRS